MNQAISAAAVMTLAAAVAAQKPATRPDIAGLFPTTILEGDGLGDYKVRL